MKKLSPVGISWTLFQRAIIYIAVAILSSVAFRWLYVFSFTDYRSHHRLIMILLALVTLVLAIGLFRLSAVAVVVLLVIAGLAGAGALYIQVYGGAFHPFLASLVAGSVLYFCVLIPHFSKRA